MPETRLMRDADDLVREVPDGSRVAVFKDNGIPMEIARALARAQVRDLDLVTVPTSGLFADLLIGAGCVLAIETAGVSLGEFGPAHNFTRAVRGGTLKIKDSTCPAIYAGLQAGQKGIPFMPLRGLVGSDILNNRPDYAVIDNPFAENDPIVALPAIRPDIAVMHVPLADRHGNLWLGRAAELKILAHASARTLATAEEIIDGNLLDDDRLAPACLPRHYVTALAPAPRGAWPYECPGPDGLLYGADADHLHAYATRTRDPAEMRAYLIEQGLMPAEAAE